MMSELVMRRRGEAYPLPSFRLAVLDIDYPLPGSVHLRRFLCELHSRDNGREGPHVDFVLCQRRVAYIVAELRALDVNSV